MKPNYILLIFTLLAINLKAQKPTPRVLPPLDKFTGKWIYKKADTVFTILLNKKATHIKDRDIDFIVGGYSLSVKGVDITNTLIDSVPKIHHGMYFEMGTDVIDTNVLHLSFFDVVTQNGGMAKLVMQKSNPNKIRWFEQPNGGIFIKKHSHNFSLPNNVILTKQ